MRKHELKYNGKVSKPKKTEISKWKLALALGVPSLVAAGTVVLDHKMEYARQQRQRRAAVEALIRFYRERDGQQHPDPVQPTRNNRNVNRGWQQYREPYFYNTRNTRNNTVKALTLAQVPFGAVMPVEARRNDISFDDVPFEEQVYLQDNLNRNGRPRRVYALPSLVAIPNQSNPVTRRRFTANNIRRVAGGT